MTVPLSGGALFVDVGAGVGAVLLSVAIDVDVVVCELLDAAVGPVGAGSAPVSHPARAMTQNAAIAARSRRRRGAELMVCRLSQI
jgi:hypothetical protein